MLDLGIKVDASTRTIPAYFGGYLGENWTQAAEALDLSRADLVALAKQQLRRAHSCRPAAIAQAMSPRSAPMSLRLRARG